MKTIYKNSLNIALSALVCAFLAFPASAQHRTGDGGSGGSRQPSGGSSGGSSSVSSSRPASSGGSSAGVSRPSSSYSPPPQRSGGVQPGSYSAPRQGGVASNLTNRGGYNNGNTAPRQGVAGGLTNRGNYGFAPRQGVANTGIATRGNYNYAPRQGVADRLVNRGNYAPRYGASPRGATSGGLNYRTSPRIGYGHGGYWGNHGYYHYHRGYYGSYYLPRLGFTCAILPGGYYPFYFGDYQYYYSDGLYYQFDNNQYTVVEPPIGAEITTLPEKAQSIVINGQQYYELNGVYYQPVTKDDGTLVYMIAGKDGELNTTSIQDDEQQGPQMGDIVSELPPDCRKIKVNGEKLWVSPDGVYYQELPADEKGNKTYKVVGLPTDEQPEQN